MLRISPSQLDLGALTPSLQPASVPQMKIITGNPAQLFTIQSPILPLRSWTFTVNVMVKSKNQVGGRDEWR